MPATRRWRLVVAYDGNGFRGFARQKSGVTTVAGTLAAAIGRAARLAEPPAIVCAGRTDAGVHAAGQVVHVDLPAGYDADLGHAVNRQTAPSVVVRRAAPADEGFDARRSARWRRYRYLVHDADVPDPLLAPVAWHVAEPLDLRAMAAAADPLIGEHDFRAFCRRAPGRSADEPITRRVLEAGWRQVETGDLLGEAGAAPGRLLRFDIVAASFCHQMVRSIVGTMVDVGRGRLHAGDMTGIILSRDRKAAGVLAPPQGLCLEEVGY